MTHGQPSAGRGRDRHRADSHKRTHTVVAVDQVGRWLGERTVRATSDGHLELLRWSAQWPQVRFALEDGRHLTRRLEADLLAAGGGWCGCRPG
jgi:transposase